MPVMTGLSGNEMFCLNLKGLAPGELVIGNSVHSLGLLGSLGAGFRPHLAAKSRRLRRSSARGGTRERTG